MRGPGWVVFVAACSPVDLGSVAITPAEPTSVDDLVVAPTPPEGEVWTWSWTRDGVEVPEVAGDRVPAALTARGEVWEVSVVRYDGRRTSDPQIADVVVGNTPPTVVVRLTPDPPDPAAPLTAVVDTTDADADPITLSYQWTVDGEPSAVDGPTIAGGDVNGGERWEVTVTASDGDAEGVGTASAAAGNTAPQIVAGEITPAAPADTDVLSVVWEGADADGDPVTVHISWEVDGVVVFEGDTLETAFFERADTVRARIEPFDGQVAGTVWVSDTVVIANGAPSATSAVVVPPVISEGVIASCELVGGADPEGDPVDVTVRWFVDGTFVATSPTLTGATFQKGDQLVCEATPSDGETSGEPVMSPPVAVANTPPAVGTVTLSPAVPNAGEDVIAVVDGFVDSDGDAVTSQTRWYVDNLLVGTAPSWSGLVRGQEVRAVIDPFDGEDSGTPVPSASVVVGNAPPVVERAAMIPAFPTSADVVTADTTVVDPDGDPVTTVVEWTVDGVVVSVGEVLPAGLVAAGDRLGYTATASDADDAGEPGVSPEVVVGNGPPSLGGADVVPTPLDPGDVASCVPSGAADPDGDGVDVDVLWWVNGVDAATSATLTGFGRGDVVRCELTPTDGATAGEPVWSAPVTVQ